MDLDAKHAVLSTAQAYRADSLAEAAGTDIYALMENAGKGIAEAIVEEIDPCRVAILAGPGNNGGDGFVAAHHLKAAGFKVDIFLLGRLAGLNGGAKKAAAAWNGAINELTVGDFELYGCIIDALFGAGLSRPLEGSAAVAVQAANRSTALRVAVDVPSGVTGDDGSELGEAFNADISVTFFRKKPGHLLMPGLERCGVVKLVDIGIPDRVLDEIGPTIFENHADHWGALMPRLARGTHKHQRGHLGVIGGDAPLSGAARLAARAGLRAGAGLVTTIVPAEALAIYAAHQTAVMSRAFVSGEDFAATIEAGKFSSFLVGPGNGVGEETARRCLNLLASGNPMVIDADALTAFENERETLFKKLHENVVLTPHNGEFQRLWPSLDPNKNRLEAAQLAAREAGAVLLLKGPDTIIAAPDGRAVISSLGPPSLATAGSGDVLAGLIGGLMAAGMDPLAAAAAGAWIHSEAANFLGPGLISEDLIEVIPTVLAMLEFGS
jgi:NAD(P)H-hydrate epimerase